MSSGEDDKDIPELSVQLETREGPNDQEFTEAALPKPAPEPEEQVVEDPGTGEHTLDAPMLAEATRMDERVPDLAGDRPKPLRSSNPPHSRAPY